MKVNASKIKEIREVLGISRAQMAERCGVTRQAVKNWEDGGVKTFRTLARVAEALGVAPEKLIEAPK